MHLLGGILPEALISVVVATAFKWWIDTYTGPHTYCDFASGDDSYCQSVTTVKGVEDLNLCRYGSRDTRYG
jgi:hypothetical protein